MGRLRHGRAPGEDPQGQPRAPGSPTDELAAELKSRRVAERVAGTPWAHKRSGSSSTQGFSPLGRSTSGRRASPEEQQPGPGAEDDGTLTPSPAVGTVLQERIRDAAASAAQAAERRSMQEVLALEEDLERTRREAARKLERLEGRLHEMEAKASEAEREAKENRRRAEEGEREAKEARHRAGEAEREEKEERRRAEEAVRRAHGAEAQAEEAEHRRAAIEEELAAARRQLDEAQDRASAAEHRAAKIEEELAAARRQLDEAQDRASAAEHRAAKIEEEARQELERERELRLGLESRLQEVSDLAGSFTEPASAATENGAETPSAPADEERVSVSSASMEELRGLGLSVTQAKRLIDYRDRSKGFRSLEELDYLPGFSTGLLEGLKGRLTL
jgi:DNA uptake protein ComE-like DNA-binding protein